MTEQATEPTPIPPVSMTGDDPEAPYGRMADGSPRKKPGRKPGQTTGTGRPTRQRTSSRATNPPILTDYKTPILGLMQIPAGALAIAGMQRPVFLADSAAITIHAEPIATALDQLAQERPEIAQALNRVLQVGPYGILIAAVAPLVLQILANHNVLPGGTMGTVPPPQLVLNFVGPEAAEAMQRAAAERERAAEQAPDFQDNGQRAGDDGTTVAG
jgi:hypothetical protein